MDNMLNHIKKLLGISKEYTHFDDDVLSDINTALGILTQLNVGDPKGFIANKDSKWSDFVNTSDNNLEMIKSYVHLKVRLLFDPPANAVLIANIKDNISELEFRILDNADF